MDHQSEKYAIFEVAGDVFVIQLAIDQALRNPKTEGLTGLRQNLGLSMVWGSAQGIIIGFYVRAPPAP